VPHGNQRRHAVLGTRLCRFFSHREEQVWCECHHTCFAGAHSLFPPADLLVVNNLRDRVTDAAAGKRTLVVRYGPTAARRQYLALVGLSYAVPALVAVTTGAWFWLLPLLSLPLAHSEWKGVRDQDGPALNARLAGTARLGLVHGLLLAVGVAL